MRDLELSLLKGNLAIEYLCKNFPGENLSVLREILNELGRSRTKPTLLEAEARQIHMKNSSESLY